MCVQREHDVVEESYLLLCSDVSFLLRGAPHARHLDVAFQLREGQTQVQTLDGDQGASFQRSCNWAHLHRKHKEVRMIGDYKCTLQGCCCCFKISDVMFVQRSGLKKNATLSFLNRYFI